MEQGNNVLAFRIPVDVSKEEKKILTSAIKKIARELRLNYFELFSIWANGKGPIVKQFAKQKVEQIDATEKSLKEKAENIEQFVKQNVEQISFIEKLIEDKVIELMEKRQGKEQVIESEKVIADKENVVQKVKQNVKQSTLTDLIDSKKNISQDKRGVLERIKMLKEEGLSDNKIAKMFNQEGLPTFSGYGKWHSGTISKLLK
jgi:hypothetical protein